ncbi:MAG: hypothetical protein PHE51_06270 [Eubacteriales bacterium]|nr:hypothetical protein [Eubacteriales bacterium]
MNKKIIVVSVILVLISILFAPILRNNILLGLYANQLYSIPLPNETTEITRDKAVGNLYGTGNHLDFVATMEIESSLSESELIKYYTHESIDIRTINEISIIGLDRAYIDLLDTSVEQKVDAIPKSKATLVYGSSRIYTASQNTSDKDSNIYIIQIKDTHYAPGFDLRAH